jgi:hypothetical protein
MTQPNILCLVVGMLYIICLRRRGFESSLAHHHHHPLIPLSGVGTTCFLLPFSSITRHLYAYSFYSHVSPLLGCPSTFILITLFVMWLWLWLYLWLIHHWPDFFLKSHINYDQRDVIALKALQLMLRLKPIGHILYVPSIAVYCLFCVNVYDCFCFSYFLFGQ